MYKIHNIFKTFDPLLPDFVSPHVCSCGHTWAMSLKAVRPGHPLGASDRVETHWNGETRVKAIVLVWMSLQRFIRMTCCSKQYTSECL